MAEWKPPGVGEILAVGGTHYIGLLENDLNTVLKYPRVTNNIQRFEKELELGIEGTNQEGRIYKSLGPHNCLVAYRGTTPHGIKLEYVRNGSLETYLRQRDIGEAAVNRLCLRIAKGAVFFHAKKYIYCDFNARNILVDENLNPKFCDLQGQLSDDKGNVIVKPWGIESVKSRWPKAGEDEASVKTDLFALGTTMYFILYRHLPFPDLDENENEGEIKDLFLEEKFPPLPQTLLGQAIRKCWTGAYTAATDLVRDLEACEVGSQHRSLMPCCIVM